MAMSSIQPRSNHAWILPNILTYGRVVAVPVVVAFLFWPGDFWMRWTAFGVFVAAGVTDFFDGYLARIWSQQSSLGRMLDPIADKLLVASVLMVLVANQTITSWSIWAAIVILCREILVSGLREYLAELRVSVPVSRIAKWNGSTWLPDNDIGGAEIYEAFASVSGNTISPTISLPATDRQWRINLYRTGVRMTYGLDFTISGGNILLTIAGQDEAFLLLVK